MSQIIRPFIWFDFPHFYY